MTNSQPPGEAAPAPPTRWYVQPALSPTSTRCYTVAAAIVVALAVGACGGGARQDANEPGGNFTVSVPVATFPALQRLAQHTHLVLSVHNAGSKTIPNVAVTICNITCAYPAPPGAGTEAQAFAQVSSQPYLANPSRPIWIVDRPPGPCRFSCLAGGPGGAVTAYSNTWALGALQPGATATFDWGVTAVAPGKHVVAWEVAAGLNGKAKAVLADGSVPSGTFTVFVRAAPQQTHVNDAGQVVPGP